MIDLDHLEVQAKFPEISDPSRTTPHGNPFCKPLGLVRTCAGDECCVVNEEKGSNK